VVHAVDVPAIMLNRPPGASETRGPSSNPSLRDVQHTLDWISTQQGDCQGADYSRTPVATTVAALSPSFDAGVDEISRIVMGSSESDHGPRMAMAYGYPTSESIVRGILDTVTNPRFTPRFAKVARRSSTAVNHQPLANDQDDEDPWVIAFRRQELRPAIAPASQDDDPFGIRDGSGLLSQPPTVANEIGLMDEGSWCSRTDHDEWASVNQSAPARTASDELDEAKALIVDSNIAQSWGGGDIQRFKVLLARIRVEATQGALSACRLSICLLGNRQMKAILLQLLELAADLKQTPVEDCARGGVRVKQKLI